MKFDLKQILIAICVVMLLCNVCTSYCLCSLNKKTRALEDSLNGYATYVNELFQEQYKTNVDIEYMVRILEKKI